jgi:superfamily II DNA/RNA helicase
MSQEARERSMAAFKAGKKDVLIATDVAARGIDVDDVTHVINHTIPDDEKTYLHRAGRTGRAGKTGIAVTFVDWDDLHKWALINRALEFGQPEPVETYSSSPHLYDRPRHPRGHQGPHRQGAQDGVGAHAAPGTRAGGRCRGRRTAEAGTRRRRRRRSGSSAVGSTFAEGASAGADAAASASDDASALRRRRRNARRHRQRAPRRQAAPASPPSSPRRGWRRAGRSPSPAPDPRAVGTAPDAHAARTPQNRTSSASTSAIRCGVRHHLRSSRVPASAATTASRAGRIAASRRQAKTGALPVALSMMRCTISSAVVNSPGWFGFPNP